MGCKKSLNCINCSLHTLADLHYKRSELEGGELFVLEESIKQKKVFPCELITPIECLLKLWLAAYEAYKVEELIAVPPMLFFSWQSINDLKASAFLAMSGHYRSAAQILRPVVENTLVSRYFEEKIRRAVLKKEELQEWRKFDNWASVNRHRYDFRRCLDYLKDAINVIGNAEEIRLDRDLWKELIKYTHTYIQCWDISDGKPFKDPGSARFDEERLDQWLNLYLNITSYIMEMLYYYFPDLIQTEMSHDALCKLMEWTSIDAEYGRSMIKSRYMLEFIQELSSSIDKFSKAQENSNV